MLYDKKKLRLCSGWLLLGLAVSIPASAHVVVQELDNVSQGDAAMIYLCLALNISCHWVLIISFLS